MPDTSSTTASQLQPYLPAGAADEVAALLAPHTLKLIITKPRKTKKGDYRPPQKGCGIGHRITINCDLNPYAFLVTLLHELAHLEAHEQYNLANIQPHGPEWKALFRCILMPFQERGYFPETVSRALEAYLQNPAAATCSSPTLSRALRMYDKQQDEVFISEVPFQGYFYWQGHRLFQRLSKQRTRYNALEVDTGRYYRFSQQALVRPQAAV